MLSFAVVVGSAIPHGVHERLADPCPVDLAFRPTQHLVWSDGSGRVLFAGWQDGTGTAGASRWHATPDRLTAISGNAWPRTGAWRRDEPWAAQVGRRLEARPADEVLDDLLGIHCVAHLTSDGRGFVVGDGLGTSPLFRARIDGATVITSRAPLAARLASTVPDPPRDAWGAGWLAFCGYPMGARTGFDGVEAMAVGERAEIGAGSVHFTSRTPSWRRSVIGDRDEALDAVHADVTTSIRAALAQPVERRVVELTGGKDSRVVLGALVAEGLADRFEYRTFGPPDLPDVVVARQLAERLGLRHGLDHQGLPRRSPALQPHFPGQPERELRLRANVGGWSGARNAWELATASPPSTDVVTLSGIGGEALATNHPETSGLRNHAQLQRALLVGSRYGAARILRPDALAYYRTELLALAYDGFSEQDPPQDVVDAWYIRERLRRWFGTTQEADEWNHVHPLHSAAGVALAFALGPGPRRSYWMHRRLLERTCPTLAEMPFAGAGWPTTDVPSRTPEPGRPHDPTGLPIARDRRSTARRLAGRALRRRPAVVSAERRRQVEHEDGRLMQRYLVAEPPTALLEVLDRAALASAVAGFDRLGEQSKRQLYGALTAAIWLAEDEITPRTTWDDA